MTVTAIQTTQPAQLAPMFTAEQERMILSNFLGGASKDEATVLLEIVKRRRLDPFSRQVYFVKRWDSQKREEVWAIQTSIDGLRSIADRTGNYEGQTAPQWCGADGVWHDVWLDKKPPMAARVGVYKTHFREPAYGIARYDAYVQTKKDGTPTQFWLKMSDLMLAKCAEALAIRKAFPEDTSGLYVPEEMGEAAREEIAPSPPVAALPPAGAVEAPRQTHANVAAAAQVLDGKVEPKATKPPPPPHVMALFTRCLEAEGKNKKLAQARFTAGAERVFGPNPKPSNEWTAEDAAKVEAAIWPADIEF